MVSATKRTLLLVIAALSFSIVVFQQLFSLRLPSDALQDMLTLALSVIYEALPFITLGVLASTVFALFVSENWLLHHLPKRPALRRLILSFSGILIPVCECGNVPVTRSLLMKGMSTGEAITFLLAAPVLNPITLFATTQAFPADPVIVVSRAVATLFIANAIGWIVDVCFKKEAVLTPSFAAVCAADEKVQNHHSKRERALDSAQREIQTLLPSLLVGSAVAAAIQTFVPREWLLATGTEPVLSILAMLLLAFIVSICANVDAFFALAFSAVFNTGALVAFLVFGPMVDIKIFTMLSTTFTKKFLLCITVLAGLFAFMTGLVVQHVF